MKKKFINLTPHTINLNSGTSFEASGIIARVSASYTKFDNDGIVRQEFGEVENLPAPKENTIFIVSALVLSAVNGRDDVVAPATGHPFTIRNDQGHIISVPGFVRK